MKPQISTNGMAARMAQPANESDSNGSSSGSSITSSNEETKQSDDEKDESGKDMFQQLFHCKICNEIVPVIRNS
jgi:ribosomal protein L12E/L44/L45/RPP1/RPP2